MAWAALLLLLGGCGGAPANEPATPAERRARDSTIGASALPGAGGVRGALRASDSAAARASRVNAATADSGT